MEKINATLNAVKALRSSVRQCFEQLADGTTKQVDGTGVDQAEESRNKFLVEFQENYGNINQQLRLFFLFKNWLKKYKFYIIYFREVESLINGLQVPMSPYYLGNTTYLAQEITQERQAMYSQLVNSYKWIDKVCKFLNDFIKNMYVCI